MKKKSSKLSGLQVGSTQKWRKQSPGKKQSGDQKAHENKDNKK